MLRIASLAGPVLLLLVASLSAEAADFSFCSVLRSPKKYNRQELTMTVGYRVGFEWQELVCASCNISRKVWVEFDPDVKGAQKFGKPTGGFDALYRVRVRGVFVGEEGHYGHLNGYEYVFLVKEVLSAHQLWQMTPQQPTVPAHIAEAACRP